MYSTSYMEDFVKNLYKKIGIFEPHQLNYHQIADNLGINIFYWQESSQALFLNNFAYIFLNNQLNNQQKWQDFCHELAHLLLHAGNQRKLSKEFINYQESKANNFMYHACVPSFMLNQLKIKDNTYETIEMIQELFCVEANFAKKRLEQYLNNLYFQSVIHNRQLTANRS